MDSFRNIRDDGIIDVPTAADRLALLPKDGDIVQQLDTHSLYSYDGTTETWILISQPAVGTLVTSVFGRVGDVVAESGDYSGDQISQDSTHRFVTDTEKSTWNSKEPAITAGITSQYWRGDKTFQTLDKSAVGLSNVDNTSDASKPISTDTQTALNNKVSYTDMQKTQLVYVSPSGSNTTGDGSFARPYLTIAYAISNTLDGSTIFLLPGLYTESTVVIPASTGSRSFRGFSASSTELQNGIIHTANASNINISFDSININSATLDESAAINGFVYFTRCWFNVTRIDSNPSVVFTNTESNVSGASLSGSNNVFNEALVLGVIVCSGGFNIFENCKFVTTLEAQGTALVRMLDCELFGAATFINGTIVSGNTPSWEVDLVTDYLGGFTGAVNKTILANISSALGYTPENVVNKVTDFSSPDNTTYPTTLAVSTSVGVVSDAFIDMKEPNGFVNRTDSTISFDHTTRIFTIAPVAASYAIYVASVKRTITTSKSVTIPNTTGTYYFYIDSTGALSYATTFNISLISTLAYCALVYWDAGGTGSERVVTFGDERHGITMDGQTHAYLHTTRGAAYGNGCGLTGFTISAGNDDVDAQFTALSGLIWDEDIKFDLSSQATFPILYRSNGSWKRKNADSFPLIYNGVAGYTGTRPAYNLNTAGVWSLAEVTNTDFWLIHIFATNDINTPFVGILGQNKYNNSSAARTGAKTEIYTIAELPVTEFCPIGSVIFQTNNSYSNTPKAKVVEVSAGVNFVDFRLESVRPGVLA